MSEKKTELDEYEDEEQEPDRGSSSSPGELPEHQYSKERLVEISETDVSKQRPECLDKAYDTVDGKWDPERWWYASREDSPLTVDGKGGRKIIEFDRDSKRKLSVNDPVERLKEERDGIVLSPQRRSFGTGCHVQQSVPYMRQSSLTERDRDEGRGERERDRDRERDRAAPRKIGSGRIPIDRDGGRDFSNLRDRDRDRDRDIPWGRERLDRDRDRERDRDDWDRDRDRRFDRDRSDRYRRDSEREYMDNRNRDRRDYRPYDRSGRRRNYSEDEKEPEWFTGGPTSQTDTIELRGFESENQKHPNGLRLKKAELENETEKVWYRGKIESVSESDQEGIMDKQCKEDEVFANSSTTQPPQMESEKAPKRDHHPMSPQDLQHQNRPTDPATASNFFDLDEFLKSNLPLSEDSETQGSRFSQFFRGSSGNAPTHVTEDMLMPKDLLDDNRSSPYVPSPSHHPAMMHMKAPPGFYSAHLEQDSSIKEISTALPYSSGSIPNSAGDNNASSKAGLPASVTALFNRAAPPGSNASLSSNSSFSTQDAEAQLKAMLFGGPRDSASSSGTASPAGVPPNFQKRVKTVAELEADMIQNSPKKMDSPVHVATGAADDRKDMTAFNKFLIMINAASEANQNTTRKDVPHSSGVQGMIPSHSEFTKAVMRNKEHQMELLQQSMNLPPGSPMQGALPHHPSSEYASHPHLSSQAATNLPPHVMGPVITGQQQRTAVHAGFAGLTPQSTSTPQVPMQPNASKHHSHPAAASNPSSSDPIFNLIQQNPTIVMKPASPSLSLANIMASQASGIPASARVPSPIMFGQQPPLHLNAPSPIHPSQLSPASLNSPSRSPVLKRGISPQELAVHAQAVMQSALLKKQLQNQSERYIKKQQERAKSPNRQVVKPQPAAQPILPPTPQPKGSTVNTFTPTSVLVKMHSDKAMEKEKQAQEIGDRKPMEYMPSMEELSCLRSEGNHAMIHNARDGDMSHGNNISVDMLNHDGGFHGGRIGCPPAPPDASDISFLDPINQNLVPLENQMDALHVNPGQINILPGGLSQPMSVEEKMKLSSLVEKPGYLRQILDAQAAHAESAKHAAKMGRRPIVRAVDQPLPEEMMPPNQPPPGQPQHVQIPLNQQQQQILQGLSMGRPVMGSGGMKGPNPMLNSSVPAPMVQTSSPVFQNAGGMVSATAANKPGLGRAIVGSATAHPPPAMGNPVLHPEMMRQYEQQKQQQLQQHLQHQSHVAQAGIGIPPPPPGAIPYMAAAPPPLGMHRVPIHPANHAALMQQHMARANAMNAARAPHLMALHHPGQSPGRPMATMPGGIPSGIPSGPLSPPQGHQAMGSLSASALSATIQQVSSPHNKMNGPMVSQSSGVNGGGPPMEMSGGNVGIQRWFSSDILKTQLPSMPPLPTHSGQVMTVDELERI